MPLGVLCLLGSVVWTICASYAPYVIDCMLDLLYADLLYEAYSNDRSSFYGSIACDTTRFHSPTTRARARPHTLATCKWDATVPDGRRDGRYPAYQSQLTSPKCVIRIATCASRMAEALIRVEFRIPTWIPCKKRRTSQLSQAAHNSHLTSAMSLGTNPTP